MKKTLSNEEQESNIVSFQSEYNSLCEKYGLMISVIPYLAPTNHGTFEIAQKVVIKKLEKKNNG